MLIQIRLARLSEMSALTELSMRSKQSNGYDDAFMEACREELTVSKVQVEAGEFWVAAKETLCGCVCLSVDDQNKVGEVHAFFVDPDCQRQGIGKLLWDKVLEQARLKGLMKLQLDSDPNAVPFYEAMGFTIVGESPSGSIKGRVLPCMELSIG